MKTETEKLIYTYIAKFIRDGKLITSYLINATSIKDAYLIAESEQPINCTDIYITRLRHEILNDYAY